MKAYLFLVVADTSCSIWNSAAFACFSTGILDPLLDFDLGDEVNGTTKTPLSKFQEYLM